MTIQNIHKRSYLFLLDFQVDLGFQGNRCVQAVQARRGILGCQEGLEDQVVRESCCDIQKESGWASCQFCSSDLQKKKNQTDLHYISVLTTSNFLKDLEKVFSLFTSCSQTCLAMERIMFWDAKSPWKTKTWTWRDCCSYWWCFFYRCMVIQSNETHTLSPFSPLRPTAPC